MCWVILALFAAGATAQNLRGNFSITQSSEDTWNEMSSMDYSNKTGIAQPQLDEHEIDGTTEVPAMDIEEILRTSSQELNMTASTNASSNVVVSVDLVSLGASP